MCPAMVAMLMMIAVLAVSVGVLERFPASWFMNKASSGLADMHLLSQSCAHLLSLSGYFVYKASRAFTKLAPIYANKVTHQMVL